MDMEVQSVSESSNTRFSKLSWRRLLLGTLIESGGLGYYAFLNSKDRPSKWMLASFIAGTAGVILVSSAIMDMSKRSREYSEDLLCQKSPEKETGTEKFSEESSSETLNRSPNSKNIFVNFIDVRCDLNTLSAREMFDAKCLLCKHTEENEAPFDIFGFEHSFESYDYPKRSNSNIKILFPARLHELVSSRLRFFRRGSVTRESAYLKDKILLVLSEFNNLLNHSKDPQLPIGNPNVLYMSQSEQDTYVFPSNLSWESHAMFNSIETKMNILRTELLLETSHFERVIIDKWESESEKLRSLTVNGAFGILTDPEFSFVQESGIQTEFEYPEDTRSDSRSSVSKCVQQ